MTNITITGPDITSIHQALRFREKHSFMKIFLRNDPKDFGRFNPVMLDGAIVECEGKAVPLEFLSDNAVADYVVQCLKEERSRQQEMRDMNARRE